VTTTFETKINDIVLASGPPTLNLTLSHGNPADLSITLTAPNGTVISVKSQGTATIPASTSLTTLSGIWLTGMFKLSVTDWAAGSTGTLSAWSVSL
jgi:subtilisin-like proprotein convertase family protein